MVIKPLSPNRVQTLLSDFRITSFSPDQTSLTAHTFTSTNPSGSAISRIVSSVISVGTFDDFLGHETQTNPSCFNSLRRLDRVASRNALSDVNTCAASNGGLASVTNSTPSGNLPNQETYSFGALTVNSFRVDLRPSFFAREVAE